MQHQQLFKAIGCALLASSMGIGVANATNWLQFGYDQAHSSNNPNEPGYSTASTTLAPVQINGAAGVNLPSGIVVDHAPVYLSNVTTANGVKNVLYMVSKNGTILAVDAATDAVIWKHQPVSGGPTNGAPAIDPQLDYVYAYALDGTVRRYAAGTGVEFTGNGWPQVSTIKPSIEKGAAGLAFATAHSGTTYLYSVIDGYIGDGGDYQGHITAIDLTRSQATFAQHVFNSQCSDLVDVHMALNGFTDNIGHTQNDCVKINGGNSGIWGRPGTIYDTRTDRIYIATGNGLFDPGQEAQSNGRYWGDSLLALNPNGTGSAGKPLASYTAATYGGMQGSDADMGSTAMAILPTPANSTHPHLALIGGKDGCLRLLNLDGMSTSALRAGNGAAAGELQAIALPASTGNQCTNGNNGDQVRTQPAVWVNPADGSTWVFIASDNNLIAYQLTISGTGAASLVLKWSDPNGGTSPVIANNTLYYVSSGSVRAIRPSDTSASGHTLLWSDSSIGSIHWQSPIVADGHLYVIDNASKVWTYALDGVFKGSFD